MAPALELLHNGVQGLDAVLDVVDGGAVVEGGKFLVQDFHLRHGYFQCAAV